MISFRPQLWFETLFGFKETLKSVHDNIDKLEEEGNYKIKSKLNQMTYNAGNFQIRNIESFKQLKKSDTPGTFNILRGRGRMTSREGFKKIDAFSMQSLKENDGATYLAASNFNCLEFVSPRQTYEDGITAYYADITQGPYTALACPQSALLRNYFWKHPGKKDHDESNESINLLSNTKLKDYVKNGYVVLSRGDCKTLSNQKIDWSDENKYSVGVHNYCDVLMTRGNEGNFEYIGKDKLPQKYGKIEEALDDQNKKSIIANHVYAASFNFNGDVDYNKYTISIVENLLKAEYKATILAAQENSIKMKKENRQGYNKLYITLIGGGVFGNPLKVIANAISSCKDTIIESGINVYLVCFDISSFNQVIPLLLPLINDTGGQVIDIE